MIFIYLFMVYMYTSNECNLKMLKKMKTYKIRKINR